MKSRKTDNERGDRVSARSSDCVIYSKTTEDKINEHKTWNDWSETIHIFTIAPWSRKLELVKQCENCMKICVCIVDMCRCAESFFSRFLFADSRSNFTCFNSVLRIELTAPICRREIKHSGGKKMRKREEEKESELWASRMMLNSTLEDSKLIIIPNYAETNVVFLLLLLFIVTSRIISYAIR